MRRCGVCPVCMQIRSEARLLLAPGTPWPSDCFRTRNRERRAHRWRITGRRFCLRIWPGTMSWPRSSRDIAPALASDPPYSITSAVPNFADKLPRQASASLSLHTLLGNPIDVVWEHAEGRARISISESKQSRFQVAFEYWDSAWNAYCLLEV